MRNRLLTVLAVSGAMLLSAPAFAWDDPELTFVDPDLTEDSSGGGEYMIYHVGQGLFCNDGNWTETWDSQLVIRDSGLVATLTWGQDYELSRHDETESDYNDGYGWRISMFEGNGSTSSTYFCELYLYSGECICTDHNAQGHILWQFEAQGNQVYKIRISDTDPTYGTGTDYEECYWGVDPDDDGVYPLTNVASAGYEDYECEWKFVEPDVYEVYYAKKQLQKQLEAADEAGYTDYSTYASLYTGSSATPDELLEAAEELQAEVLEYQYADATSDNPVNVTSIIENPYFEDGSSDGWTTYRENSTGNFAYKSSSTTITFADGSTSDTGDGNTDDDGNTWYFWERWYWTTSGDWYVEQDLTDMPRGKYVLSCYAFTNGSEEGAGDGFYLRATVNGVEYETQGVEVCPEDYSAYATKMEVEFSVLGSEATIGFYYEDCADSYWTGVGGFNLYYYGTEGMETLSSLLLDEIEEAEAVYAEYEAENVSMSNSARENYETVIANAQAAAESGDLTDEELTEYILEITTMLSDMADDIEAYETLITTINSLYDEWDNSDLADADFTDYENFLADLEDQYNGGTFDVSTIDSVAIWADEIWKACVLSAVDEGLTNDLTILVENADFDDEDDYGWTFDVSSSSGTNTINYSCGEVWGSAFDVYQELTGLPSGSYKITAQGYYRPSSSSNIDTDSATSRANYPVIAYLYGNEASVKICHWYDYYYTEPYDEDNDKEVTSYFGDNVYYVPNNMYSAAYAFSLGYYPNEVTCYVTDEGTLRLGICTDDDVESNCWCIFDTFTLTYLGADDMSGASYTLEALIEEAQEYLDSEDLITTEAADALNAAIEAANEGLSNLDVDTYNSLTDALNDAIDEAVDAQDACSTFEEYAWNYLDALVDGEYDEYLGTDEYDAFEALMYDEIELYLDGDEQLESTEQIDELTVKIAKAYGEMIAKSIDVSSASTSNPIDVTDFLSTPSFSVLDEDDEEEASMSGWTSNYDGLDDECCFEFYNTEDTYIYQNVYALAKGYYTLTYNGFYRAGSYTNAGVIRRDLNEEDSLKAYAYVSIEDDGSYWTNTLASIFECVQEFKYSSGCLVLNDSLFNDDDEYANLLYKVIVNSTSSAELAFEDGYYEGSIVFYVSEDYLPVQIGIKKDGLITSDWTIFDNFALTYYGSDQPEGYVDAIEGVEAADDTENVVSTKWYTINGMEVSEPSQRGIYIRQNVLADGTKQVVKVLIP